jgi:hypothetical protein
MTDFPFDRFTRLLAESGSRRQALAALGALAAARLQPARAAQIEVAACGAAGAVCTALKGCCTGLMCATSTMNPTYGVCVTGEGDMLPVTDGVIVPGSEGITEELAAQASEATANASEAESLLADQDAEIQSRQDARDARASTRQTRLQTHRSAVRSRKAAHRTNSGTNKALKRLNREPKLELSFSLKTDGSEVLRVDNLERGEVVLSRVQSLTDAVSANDFEVVTIPPESTYWLVSGTKESPAPSPERQLWTPDDICTDGNDGDGVRLTVARFGGTETHQIEVLCDPPPATGSTTEAVRQPGTKQRTKQKSQRTKRPTRKPAKRDKGT